MKPNLLHITLTDGGGAGKAANNVYLKLKSLGYPSQIVTLKSSVLSNENIQIRLSLFSKIKRKILLLFYGYKKKKNPDYQMTGINEIVTLFSSTKIIEKLELNPDFIFIYWISGFLNAKNLYELHRKYNATIILHLTDMVSFTGGCHFSLNCEKYKSRCGACPGIYSLKSFDSATEVFLYKKKYYDKIKLAVVVGSSNLYNQVKQSFLLNDKPIYKIKYHLEVDDFFEINKDELRLKYGIGKDKKVIFFGATQINQKRKGFDYLIKSLNHLSKQINYKLKNEIVLIIAGSNYESILTHLPFSYISLGLIKNSDNLHEIYQLSDLYLNTSIDDIGPYMLIEAMLSKCLTISYNVGLATDLIIDRETGFLNKNKDYISYSSSIYDALKLKKEQRKVILENAYDKARKQHEWKLQPKQYEIMFNNEK